MQANWRPQPGEVLDGVYRLETSHGVMEVGERFDAVDVRDDSPVAVTCLHPVLFEGAHRGPNTLRVQRSRAYAHANIAGVRDVVLSGEVPYVVTERCAGDSMERWILGHLPMGEETLDGVVAQIVEALETVHMIGVHGNLQPANIFIGDDGRVTLVEPWFLEGGDGAETGQLRARQAHWMAPEQRGGGWQERQETDVFLLGALVGWLMAGRAVIPGTSLIGQQVAISEAVDAVLLKATAKRPEERYVSARDFWGALQDARREPSASEASSSAAPPIPEEASAPELPGADAAPPPLDDLGADLAAWDEEEDDVSEPTEAIPLDELAAMGLDPQVSGLASEVDAIMILDAEVAELDGDDDIVELDDLDAIEVIPLVTDTSFIPMESPDDGREIVDAIVEVGIIQRESSSEPPSMEARTIQVVPGPGSAKALEAARRAELLRRQGPEEPAKPSAPGAPVAPAAAAPPQVRSRAVYVAPFLAVLVGIVMFWVLTQLSGDDGTQGTPSPPKRAVPAAPAPLAAAPPADKAPATTAAESAATAPAAVASDAGAVAASTADASAAAPAPGPDATAVAATSDTAKAAPAPDAATSPDVKGPAGADASAPAVVEAPAPAPPPASSFEDMESADYRCPKGMSKIRSRRKVTLPDGTTKRRKVIWCTDRYEYPGKGAAPTTNVTLAAAKATCRARGRRLCRRTEWRGACGGAKFPYGREYDAQRCNTVGSGGMPRPVLPAGTKRRCKGVYGTYDMSGNVAEWTSDGTVNGGSAYKDGASATCFRSARRSGGSPYVGFRCCADPLPVRPTPEEEPQPTEPVAKPTGEGASP